MPYTEKQKTKLFLCGLIHRPKFLTGLPVELQVEAAKLFALIDDKKLVAAAKAADIAMTSEVRSGY